MLKMKRKFLWMALVLTMGIFSACSDDDDNNDNRIADPQGWAGTYGLGELTTGELDYGSEKPRDDAVLSGAFYIDWDTPTTSPYNMGKMYGITFRGILGIILPQVLNTVTLEQDGNITARYSSDAVTFDLSMTSQTPSQSMINGLIAGRTWSQSPADLASWSEQSGKLKVKLNVDAIIKQALEDSGNGDNSEIGSLVSSLLGDAHQLKAILNAMGADVSDLTINTLLDWVKNGVPLNVKTENGTHTYIYLDKGQLDMLFKAGTDGTSDFSKLMKAFSSLIPQDYQMVVNMLNMIPNNWEVTEVFSIGLDLTKMLINKNF